MKAIFLDRDGTIIIDKHYLHKVEEVEFLPGSLEALKNFDTDGYKLFLVTNQSGVSRGYFNYESIKPIHSHMNLILKKNNISPFQDIKICPHQASDQCDCRKPSPKMIMELIEKYKIDPANSFMFGDKDSDVQAGINANLKASFLIKDDKDLLFYANKLTSSNF